MKNNEWVPQQLIIGKPINQYASYAAMFCLLHSSINIKSTSAIHPAITENIEDSLVMHVPHISLYESYNALISAISNSFHNIIAVRSVLVILNFVSCTEAITH